MKRLIGSLPVLCHHFWSCVRNIPGGSFPEFWRMSSMSDCLFRSLAYETVILGGGFKYVLFSPLCAEDSQFDYCNIFQMGLTTNQVYRKGQFFPWKTWNFFVMPVPSKLWDDGETTQLCWEKPHGSTPQKKTTQVRQEAIVKRGTQKLTKPIQLLSCKKYLGCKFVGPWNGYPFFGGIKQAANVILVVWWIFWKY